MNRDDSITITRITRTGKTFEFGEADFREALGQALVAIGSNGDGLMHPEMMAHALALGEGLLRDDLIGDPDRDYSLLGTFQTAFQYLDYEAASIPCPTCGEENMDNLRMAEDGDEVECFVCKTTYSTALFGITGKPEWKQAEGKPRLFYAQNLDRYVSIPEDD